jgi:hypothetical protein
MNFIFKTNLILTLLISIMVSLPAKSQSSNGSSRPWLLSTAAEGRASKRFTLAEWLDNKDRRALMDMWLSLNTPSPYEFVIGGGQYRYSLETTRSGTTTSENFDSQMAEVSAYAKFVGLTAEYQKNTTEHFTDTTGIFNLRVFGQTVQGSHITLHYGLRTRNSETNLYRLNQQFPAATLQIYLMKYFGIAGHYRSYLPITENFYGETSGDEYQAGVFIEYGLLRFYGSIYEERQNSKLNNIETNYKRNGSKIGLQFYF